MSNTTPHKPRAPRRTSVPFSSLEDFASFWLPGRKSTCYKVGSFHANVGKKRVWFNPFRSVFVLPKRAASPVTSLSAAKASVIADLDADKARVDEVSTHWERAGGTTPEQNEARFDNLTGPTC